MSAYQPLLSYILHVFLLRFLLDFGCWFCLMKLSVVAYLWGRNVIDSGDRGGLLTLFFGCFGVEEGDRSFHARAVVFSELLKPKSVITEGVEIVEPGLDLGF